MILTGWDTLLAPLQMDARPSCRWAVRRARLGGRCAVCRPGTERRDRGLVGLAEPRRSCPRSSSVKPGLRTRCTTSKAFWFASGNGWLDGDEPQRRLSDAEDVVEAARRLSEPARG